MSKVKKEEVIKKEWDSWSYALGLTAGIDSQWRKQDLINFLKKLKDQNVLDTMPTRQLLQIFTQANLAGWMSRDSNLKALVNSELTMDERNNIVDEIIFGSDGEYEIVNEREEEGGADFGDLVLTSGEEIINLEEEDEDDNRKDIFDQGNTDIRFNGVGDLSWVDNPEIMDYFDDEAVKYIINDNINILWQEYLNGNTDIPKELQEGKFDGQNLGLIKNAFLSEYHRIKKFKLPEGYQFTNNEGEFSNPTDMQILTALRLKDRKRFGNWSGTGGGKTLSAILASRTIDAKITFIITNNATVGNWSDVIDNAFPKETNNILVKEKKDIVSSLDMTKHNYIIFNYETFQKEMKQYMIDFFKSSYTPDLIILDEVQMVIKREDDISNRRKIIYSLVSKTMEKNPNVHVLSMSATPVINSLYDAKSTIEITTGKQLKDVSTTSTVNNALNMHKHIINLGLRYRPIHSASLNEIQFPKVDGNDLLNEFVGRKKGDILAVENILIHKKLEIVRNDITDGTIIYVEYVGGLVETIKEFIETELGLTVGLYTGFEKSGKEDFLNKKVNVLIGSSAIGTGVDGLQNRSNKMIFLSLPWTNAKFTQACGRIHRAGSAFKNVTVIVPQVVMTLEDDNTWSWDQQRFNRITHKGTLADAAVDGIVPSAILPSIQKMLGNSLNQLNQWIDRLDDNKVYFAKRDHFFTEFSEEARKEVGRKLGNFSAINKQWSTSKSTNTNTLIKENPDMWKSYHADYREARKSWADVPYIEIAKELRKLPLDRVIGDFGCGENLFSTEVENEIKAFDHFAIDDSVTACDVSKLPIEDDSLDAGVFSLSLMGSNYIDYLTEAYRVLKPFSPLYIAEPRSKWEERKNGVQQMIDDLTTIGYSNVEVYKTTDQFIYVSCIKK